MLTRPLSRAEEAQLEGAKNLWRFNRGDLTNAAIYVGLCLALLGACWLGAHLILALPAEHVTPRYYGHLRVVNHLPIYRPR